MDSVLTCIQLQTFLAPFHTASKWFEAGILTGQSSWYQHTSHTSHQVSRTPFAVWQSLANLLPPLRGKMGQLRILPWISIFLGLILYCNYRCLCRPCFFAVC